VEGKAVSVFAWTDAEDLGSSANSFRNECFNPGLSLRIIGLSLRMMQKMARRIDTGLT
jgi:hypothetical protein